MKITDEFLMPLDIEKFIPDYQFAGVISFANNGEESTSWIDCFITEDDVQVYDNELKYKHEGLFEELVHNFQFQFSEQRI